MTHQVMPFADDLLNKVQIMGFYLNSLHNNKLRASPVDKIKTDKL